MKKITQAGINESLDNAIENGYELLDWSNEEIAVDLGTYDEEYEGLNEELIPFIQAWRETKGISKWVIRETNLSVYCSSSKFAHFDTFAKVTLFNQRKNAEAAIRSLQKYHGDSIVANGIYYYTDKVVFAAMKNDGESSNIAYAKNFNFEIVEVKISIKEPA